MDYDQDRTEHPIGIEDESDLRPLKKFELRAVTVTGTDWTVETIISQLKKGNIELNPRFQRRDAWEVKRKSSFIESLILGLPVPQIVLAERSDERGKYIVLDGKQRLLCIRRFISTSDDSEFEPFRLAGLTIRSDLNGKTFEDITQDLTFRSEISAFENQTIRTVAVRNWTDEALLFHVFLRLNTGSKPLSPQELRQALHPGPFIDFADEASSSSIAIRDIFHLRYPDFRMRDVELIIRFFSYTNRLSLYRGNLKEFLDDSCGYFNSHWNQVYDTLRFQLQDLDMAHDLVMQAFGPKFKYSKWVGSRYETRFNRAVFDIIISSFLNHDFRQLVEKNSSPCVKAFQQLCETDSKFLESIERTTKSLEATRYRYGAWFEALSKSYDHHLPTPQLPMPRNE